MLNQRALEEAIERMGVWISKHPTGTITAQQGTERFTIFPHEQRWTYQVKRYEDNLPYESGFFTRRDVDLIVHKVLLWAWQNGAQTRDYKW